MTTIVGSPSDLGITIKVSRKALSRSPWVAIADSGAGWELVGLSQRLDTASVKAMKAYRRGAIAVRVVAPDGIVWLSGSRPM